MDRITALLNFAQSPAATYLPALEAEKHAIQNALQKAVDSGSLQVLVKPRSVLAYREQHSLPSDAQTQEQLASYREILALE